MLAKIKDFGKQITTKTKGAEKDLFLAMIIILVAVSSFGLGRLSKLREGKEPIMIKNASDSLLGAESGGISGMFSADNKTASAINATDKLFMASKSGTKYYYPWCGNNIKEENKVWFTTAEEARKAGYEPAKNCKGLE